MNFVAIDFETANYKRTSACSIGLAVVENNKIVDTKHFYIKPPTSYFRPDFIDIHGITPEMVKNEPTFNQLWPKIKVNFENKVLVAHNSSFDISVLRSLLDNFQIPYPEASYCCSLKISRKLWPEFNNHKLNTIANNFGITFDHHNAEEDAVTCAHIIIKAFEKTGASSINELIKKVGIPHSPLAKIS